MRKRLISAILTIALVVSLFSVAFVSPVGAAAATTYEADRAALKTAILDLYLKSPVATAFFATLVEYGVLVDADRIDGTTATAFKVVDQKEKFVAKVAGKDVFFSDPTAFFTAIADVTAHVAAKTDFDFVTGGATDATDAIEQILKYAAMAYYFGQDEDDANVDATFNQGRNAVVKTAKSYVDKTMTALKKQVGAAAAKPADYSTEFAAYSSFSTQAYKYHPSLGINPFYNIGGTGTNPFAPYYGSSVIGLNVPIKWYTFDEIRANEDWVKLLAAFELQLRTSMSDSAAEVLYYDFVTNSGNTKLNAAFDALCAAIIGDLALGNQATLDLDKEVKAFLRLKVVVDIYTKYVKDLYNNIYTATDVELMGNVLMAQRFVEFVNGTAVSGKIEAYKLLALSVDQLNALTDKIVAGLASLKLVYGQTIPQSAIADGTNKIKAAKQLVASFPQTDANKASRDALITATNDLANMLPTAEGGKALISVAAGAYEVKYTTLAEKKAVNDAITVEFAPNYFAYLQFKANLDGAYTTFYNLVNNYSAPILGVSDGTALKNTLNKYKFLVGIVKGDVGTLDNTFANADSLINAEYARVLYGADRTVDVAYADCFYADVLGTVADTADDSFDAAIENFRVFKVVYDGAVATLTGHSSAPDYADGVTVGGNWDGDGVTLIIKNKYELAKDAVIAALKYLTMDMTKQIGIIGYVVEDIAAFFGLATDATNLYVLPAAGTADGETHTIPANYPTDYFKNFVASLNNLQKQLVLEWKNADGNMVARKTTLTNLLSAYEAFKASVKTMLAPAGDIRFDAYLADIARAADVINLGTSFNNYDLMKDKLDATGIELAGYIYITIATAPVRPYEYFAFTLASVALNTDGTNYYAFDATLANSKLHLNLINPMQTAANYIKGNIAEGNNYSREAMNKAAQLYNTATALIASVNNTTGAIGTDMPVWYAEKLLKTMQLQDDAAYFASEAIAALNAKKAAVLDPLVTEASALSVYNYVVGENSEYDAIWTAFQAAYNAAVKVQYDKLASIKEIDAAAVVLADALEKVDTIKRAEDAVAHTAEDLKAAIEDAEALLAYIGNSFNTEALKSAVNKANKEYQYNINVLTSSDIEALIASINTAKDAIADSVYTAAALKEEADAIFASVKESDYTPSSYAAFKAAYDKAIAVAAAEGTKNADAVAAIDALNAAKTALVAVVVPEKTGAYRSAVATYNQAVSALNALDESKFSPEAVANLKAAIEALKAGIDAEAADVVLIDLVVKYKLAEAGLTAIEEPDVPTLDD